MKLMCVSLTLYIVHCKVMFLNTLVISNTVIGKYSQKLSTWGCGNIDQRGKNIPTKKILVQCIENVQHIFSIPCFIGKKHSINTWVLS